MYLHSLTQEEQYLERAAAAGRFLTGIAWDRANAVMPFEIDPPAFTYFFDCGIIVRGLLAVWRATGAAEFLDVAAALGRSMVRDFASASDIHPILTLPDKQPMERDAARWSQSAGCYQLKAAMAWHELAEATGDATFEEPYRKLLERSVRDYASFLPGHPERQRVMDRLHAFSYFVEGLLPCSSEKRCAAAICDGIRRLAEYLREIAPQFARSDVYAQLLRLRMYADAAGVAPLDRAAAQEEAAALERFQAEDGSFWFGRKDGAFLPYANPVSTAFALQALALYHGEARPHRHLLI